LHAQPTLDARARQHPRGWKILKRRSIQQRIMVKARPPPSVAASWPKPNYIDPVTRGPELQIICTLLIAAVISVLALRTWVRSKVLHTMGADDWLMLAALVCKHSQLNEHEADSTSYLLWRYMEHAWPASKLAGTDTNGISNHNGFNPPS
jgi:hypothetical protein